MAVPALIPPPPRGPAEWAEQELRVLDGPRAGQRLHLFAFQRELLDVLGSGAVQEVAIMGSSQWGKTLVLLVYVLWTIAEDPCRMLYVMPSDQGAGGAKEFSRERLAPFIRATPCVAERVDGKRSAQGSNTAGSKTFAGGSISLVGARSPAGLASRPIRRVLLDEVDRFPMVVKGEGGSGGGEGTPRQVAAKRTETFGWRRKLVEVSTPVLEGGPIDSSFLAGDQRRFVVACPVCDERGVLGWLGVDFGARAPVVAAVSWGLEGGGDAALVCRRCDHRWSELDRHRAVEAGRWEPENPSAPAGRRSYHIWAAYSPFTDLAKLAADWIAAEQQAERGDTGAMVTFRQTALGLPTPGEGIIAPELERLRAGLLRRRETDWSVPAGLATVLAADVHKDRTEVLVTAWSVLEESWLLDLVVIEGHPTEARVWERLDELRARWSPRRVVVDTGYLPDPIYAYVVPRQGEGVLAIKGMADRPLWTMQQKPVRPGAPFLWLVGMDVAKGIVMKRLEKTSGPGTIHLPLAHWCDDEFVAQLTSEKQEQTWERGIRRVRWVPVRERNEALDLAAYSLYAARFGT